ncbi:MAG: hypothetical protein WEC36_15810 [Phycisphaeraceae bacterium]
MPRRHGIGQELPHALGVDIRQGLEAARVDNRANAPNDQLDSVGRHATPRQCYPPVGDMLGDGPARVHGDGFQP